MADSNVCNDKYYSSFDCMDAKISTLVMISERYVGSNELQSYFGPLTLNPLIVLSLD